MTQNEKELLLKDLSCRLPYGVKAYVRYWSKLDWKYYEGVYTVKSTFPSLNEVHVQSEKGSVDVLLSHSDYVIKPYLFPLENMTDEQRKEYEDALVYHDYVNGGWTMAKTFDDEYVVPYWFVDFCNKHHFDYRGLITMDLANDATGLNIY